MDKKDFFIFGTPILSLCLMCSLLFYFKFYDLLIVWLIAGIVFLGILGIGALMNHLEKPKKAKK